MAFIAVSTAVIVVPGPSVLLIVANALRAGIRAGFATVAGTSLAMAIQIGVAVAGLTTLVTLLAAGQAVLRWLGVAVLAYLGGRQLWNPTAVAAAATAGPRRDGSAFAQGFLVSLTNPTTLVFFVAFFPQFLSGDAAALAQFALMGGSFWVLALAFDIAYAALAARIGQAMHEPRWAVLRNRVSGAILLAAALGLALARLRDATL